MNNKRKKTKKANRNMMIIIITFIIILVIVLGFGIFKWKNVKTENNKYTATEKINKGMYIDMTSKEMYDATRSLQTSEKQGLVEMFIDKWKQDKRNNIDSIVDNETYARYLFCR